LGRCDHPGAVGGIMLKPIYKNKLVVSDEDNITIDCFDTEYIPAWDKIDALSQTHTGTLRLYFYNDGDYFGHVVYCDKVLVDESMLKSKHNDKKSPYYKQFMDKWFNSDRT
jgi:hypothetical protein